MREPVAGGFAASFARALLDPTQPIPPSLIGHRSSSPNRRFAVHRNNVVAGLIALLASRFPVVQKLVGGEFFGAMARAFVVEKPPRSPLLMRFGEDFAAFIAAFEPARELAYLPDVARLEAARTRAYHAADAAPLGAGVFTALAPESVSTMRVELHPSAEIVRSAYPIVTVWAMNSGEQELVPIEKWQSEDALVARPRLDVEVRLLPPGGAAFLLALRSGAVLAEAAEAALGEAPGFDLTCNLALLIGSGTAQEIYFHASAP